MEKKERGLWYATIAAAGVLTAWLCYLTPLQFDDLWFLADTPKEGGMWERLAATWETTWMRCTHTDTFRLANLIAPTMLVAPRIIFSLLTGFFTSLTIYTACRLAKIEAGSLLSYLAAGGVILALPWFDFMYGIAFAMNYVWTSGVALLAVRCILSPGTGLKFFLQSLLCLAGGWMHEGFSLALLCGLFLYFGAAMMRKRIINRKSLILMGLMFIGVMIISASPSMQNRVGASEGSFLRMPVREAVINAVIGGFCIYLFLATAIICLSNKKKREEILSSPHSDELLIWGGAVLASGVLFVCFYGGPRIGWAPQLFSLTGMAMMLGMAGLKGGKTVHRAVSGLIAALIIVNLAWAIKEEIYLHKEEKEIRARFLQSRDGIIFYDTTRPRLSPALFKSSTRIFNETAPLFDYSLYWGDGKQLRIVPTALERFTGRNGREAESLPGAMVFEGYLIVPQGVEIPQSHMVFTTEEGRQIDSRYKTTEFRTPDGSGWTLVMPHDQTLNAGLKIR